MKKKTISEATVYRTAVRFLLTKQDKGITPNVLNKYIKEGAISRPKSLGQIYLALLKSAQNTQQKPAVIGSSLGSRKVERLSRVLGDFDPRYVKAHYPSWEALFDTIKRKLHPRGKMRKTPKGIWAGYCRTILDAADFLSVFGSSRRFYSIIDPLATNPDEKANIALAKLISMNIHGVGFALACDFLKGMGYHRYGKPDVHIIKILKGLGICDKEDDAYAVTLALNRIARKAHVSVYTADKILWLIGSGKFNKHKDSIGKNGQLPRMREEFLRYAKARK